MEKWKAKPASHFPTPPTAAATELYSKPLRYTNTHTGTKHRAGHLHIDANTGKQFLYYSLTDRYIRAHLALMAGDAIHNLKCALDIAWTETLRKVSPAGYNPATKFPVRKSRSDLESVLTKTGKIQVGSPLFRFMVECVKSYEGGNCDIWAIHRLDIHDKHQLLLPVLNVMSIDGVELEDEQGQVYCLALALTGTIPNLIEVPFGSKFKNYGHTSIRVTFSKGIPAEGLEVIPALRNFSAHVEEIVMLLRRME